ncbi:MAG: membrane protein insertion efficiency factor YidD [Bdellovibrionota bacterium]|nr:MAG: membrane protein insertion efficiency factor YidD [Bdellovibrionota bacterium]
MRNPLIACLRLYRYLISPLLGDHCRFTPSCSAYAEQAILEHGTLRGAKLAWHRLIRCHPWCNGGFDPVPGRQQHSWTTKEPS